MPPSSSPTLLSSLRSYFRRVVHVNLCSSWLTECLRALGHDPTSKAPSSWLGGNPSGGRGGAMTDSDGNGSDSGADNADNVGSTPASSLAIKNSTITLAVYHQLLYSDLRDSVNQNLTTSPPLSTTSPLRHLLQQSSLSPPSLLPISLPKTHRQLVQVEECVDISQNATHRADHGATSQAAFANPAMYAGRCMKLSLSDGANLDLRLTSSTSPTDKSTTWASPIIAVETSPNPSLSVNTPAGTKLILLGPLLLSSSTLLLNPDNVLVLGGTVPELVEMQDKAVEAARKKFTNDKEGGATVREGERARRGRFYCYCFCY